MPESSSDADSAPDARVGLRILHTIDSSGVYGAETVLLNLASEQQRRGHVPVILSLGNRSAARKPLETEAARLGLACIPQRMRDGPNLWGARQIRQIARRHRIDVLHSHGYKSNILLSMLPRSAHACPVVTTLHGWTAKRTLSKLGLYRLLDQRLLHRHDAVVLVNSQLQESPAIDALEKCRVHVIANGIGVEGRSTTPAADDLLAQDIRRHKEKGKIIVGAIGRLSPEKNFKMLIAALKVISEQQPNIYTVILGDGPEAAALNSMISAARLTDRIRLAGYIATARQYLGLFDFLVIPSLTEGLPATLLEAMAANLPIIATRVGDIPAALGDLGLIVEPGDVLAMAAAIRSMASSMELYRAKAAGGATRVAENFGAVGMAIRYEAVYRAVLQATAH